MMTIRVPLVDLAPQHKNLEEDLISAFRDVLKSQHFIMGPAVAQFEQAMAHFCGVSECVGVSSGTDALLMALLALGIGAGDEVITTPMTFVATASAILRVGARPVFADVEPRSFNISPQSVKERITSRTKAILPVHLYGRCADMPRLTEIASDAGLYLIEDAAQAVGASLGNVKAGAFGDIGCFSLFPTKNLGALGDAGFVTTNDSDVADRLRSLRTHGARRKTGYHMLGGNFRMDTLQAALLCQKLPHLGDWNQQRQQNSAGYRRRFQVSGLVDDGRLILPEVGPGDHVFHQYTPRFQRRDQLMQSLREQGIGCRIYYDDALYREPIFADLGVDVDAFPHTEKAMGEILSLPIFPGLSNSQQDAVVDAVTRFYRD